MENNVNKSGGFAKKLLSREVLMYLLFGVLTTLVGWAVYFAIMLCGRAIFSIPNDDTSSGGYIALYSAAQVIQWVCAVLFAFFTNKKWVFTEADKSKNTFVQLYGLESCNHMVNEHTDRAIAALSAFSDHDYMQEIANQLINRTA